MKSAAPGPPAHSPAAPEPARGAEAQGVRPGERQRWGSLGTGFLRGSRASAGAPPPPPGERRAYFGVVQAKCARCGDGPCSCEAPVQAKEASGGASARPVEPPRSGGQRLPESTLSSLESRFGHDFSTVRLHDGPDAHQRAQQAGARALTSGEDIAFARGELQAGAGHADRLVAHELAHVVQQRLGAAAHPGAAGASRAHEAEADRAADTAVRGGVVGALSPVAASAPQHKDEEPPPKARVKAGLSQWFFDLYAAATFKAGATDVQVMDIVLYALLGDRWKAGLAPRIVTYVVDNQLIEPGTQVWTGIPATAAGGEEIPRRVAIFSWVVKEIAGELERLGSPVPLTPERKELLSLTGAAEAAVFQISGAALLPKWYSESILMQMMSMRGSLLRAFAKAFDESLQAKVGTPAREEAWKRREKAYTDIAQSLKPAALVLDAIRKDSALTGHQVYKLLWPPPAPKPGETPPAVAPVAAEDRAPRLDVAVGVLAYLESQPELATEATGADAAKAASARRELLDRFSRYLGWRPPPGKGDQPLGEGFALPNIPALQATLSAYPPIEPPLYDASTAGFYSFIMRLQWPSIWAAFQTYYYQFERVRVPDEELLGASKRLESLPGEAPSSWELLKARLARDARYQKADLKRMYGDFHANFGPPGTSVDPFTINALMRYAGTVFSTGIEKVTEPSHTRKFNFPQEGLYLIRARASPQYWGSKPEAYRDDSVAWMPVFARSPEVIGEQSVQVQVEELDAARRRLLEITEEKKKPGADLKKLEEEEKRLNAVVGGVGTILSYQKQSIDKRLADAASPPSEAEKKQLLEQKKKLEEIEARRTERGLAVAERLPTTFVADTGQKYVLLIEAQDETNPYEDHETWKVADSTTKKGRMVTGTGKDKPAALRSGLKALLEKGGYGRGTVVVNVGKEVFTMRVEAAGEELLKELLTNVSLLLSIAAVAAAPFTGGGSLILLVPAGVIGAIPSVYNIIDRNIDKTFEWDLETAMDLVNIVGAVVGLGAEAQLAKRSLLVGGGMLIANVGVGGTGVVLMGAQVMRQIEATKDLPPEMRSAAVLEIMAHAMLQAGIMVGAVLGTRSRLKAAHEAIGGRRTDVHGWLESLDEQTREALKKRPDDLAVYAKMKPWVREIFTLCGSFCVKIDPPPTVAEVALVEKIGGMLDDAGKRWLQSAVHDHRAQLTEKLKPLAKLTDPAAVLTALKGMTDLAGVVLAAYSPEFRTPELRAKVESVVKSGKIPMERIARVLDNVRKQLGGDPLAMLGYLEELGNRKLPGWEKVLADLEVGGNMHKGARWVLEFITRSKLWDAVKAFEVESEPGGRRWDFQTADGTLYQVKSWSRFWEATFLRQIRQDFLKGADRVRWAFESTGLGTAAEITQMMREALDRAATAQPDLFTPDVVSGIKKMLPNLVIVGPIPPP